MLLNCCTNELGLNDTHGLNYGANDDFQTVDGLIFHQESEYGHGFGQDWAQKIKVNVIFHKYGMMSHAIISTYRQINLLPHDITCDGCQCKPCYSSNQHLLDQIIGQYAPQHAIVPKFGNQHESAHYQMRERNEKISDATECFSSNFKRDVFRRDNCNLIAYVPHKES